MNNLNGEKELSKKKDEWMVAIAETQLQGIEKGRDILKNVLLRGISFVDIEYYEEICYYVEDLIDYYIPNLMRRFRDFFSLLYYAEDPKKHPELIAHINYLLAVCEQAKTYLTLSIEGADPDVDVLVEAHLGYLWNEMNLLQYNMYEENAHIIQLSFNCTKDEEKRMFFDRGYWFNLKTGKIDYTHRIRPAKVERFIKEDNTEFHVLQPEILFVYPGKLNCRIRWEKAEKRRITPQDIATVLNSAETDYVKAVNRIKESFRDSLADRNPVILVKLHKTFINGDHLVLEDEQGGMLTVTDLSGDSTPTTELLQAILPTQPTGYALLVEVNDDIQTRLFSVKPLSIVNSDRIIRLLY